VVLNLCLGISTWRKQKYLRTLGSSFLKAFNFGKSAAGILPKPFSFSTLAKASSRVQGGAASKETPPVIPKKEIDEDRLLQCFYSMLNEKFTEYEVKNERLIDDMRNTKERMEVMLKNPHNFMLNQQNCASRNSIQNPTSRTLVCFYCNQPGHYMRACLAREAHLKAGKI
jgi:hypothetical protein